MQEIIRKVESTNKLHKVCIENVRQAIEYYTPLIGKKIFLSNGSKSKINNFQLPIDRDGRNYITFKYNQLTVVCEVITNTSPDRNGVSGCYYDKKDIQLGDIKDGVLVSLLPIEKVIRDYGLEKVYDAEFIISRINEIEELKKQISELKRDIHLFI